ncbi:hypothetical protein [Nocardia asiatica]|uniref:hypothetical protein n=1 Tax=Nocardia asiatica TaxID=209252 RepID=UPI003EDEAAA7
MASVILASCQPSDDPAPETVSTPILDCDGTMPIGPQMISDPSFAKFAAGLELPPHVQIASGGARVSAAHPDAMDFSLDLCVPGSGGLPDLLAVATEIAYALKQHPLGSRTAALSIARVGPNAERRMEVREPDFRNHPWYRTASGEAERKRWEVVSE